MMPINATPLVTANAMMDPIKEPLRKKSPMKTLQMCSLNLLIVLIAVLLIFWSLYLGGVFETQNPDYYDYTTTMPIPNPLKKSG
ncbi:hypothetical protein HDE_11085 [Halotydeus destructor]|nr:hypothetical protein HDE_11085 [Halotydeus destructor]